MIPLLSSIFAFPFSFLDQSHICCYDIIRPVSKYFIHHHDWHFGYPHAYSSLPQGFFLPFSPCFLFFYFAFIFFNFPPPFSPIFLYLAICHMHQPTVISYIHICTEEERQEQLNTHSQIYHSSRWFLPGPFSFHFGALHGSGGGS